MLLPVRYFTSVTVLHPDKYIKLAKLLHAEFGVNAQSICTLHETTIDCCHYHVLSPLGHPFRIFYRTRKCTTRRFDASTACHLSGHCTCTFFSLRFLQMSQTPPQVRALRRARQDIGADTTCVLATLPVEIPFNEANVQRAVEDACEVPNNCDKNAKRACFLGQVLKKCTQYQDRFVCVPENKGL